jgi:hypothetical protein
MSEATKGKPGRPPADPLKNIGRARQLLEVFELEREHGGKWGARAAASREVADRHGLDVESFRRYLRDHRALRELEYELRLAVKKADDLVSSQVRADAQTEVRVQVSTETLSFIDAQRDLQEHMRRLFQPVEDARRTLQVQWRHATQPDVDMQHDSQEQILPLTQQLDDAQRELEDALADIDKLMAVKPNR